MSKAKMGDPHCRFQVSTVVEPCDVTQQPKGARFLMCMHGVKQYTARYGPLGTKSHNQCVLSTSQSRVIGI